MAYSSCLNRSLKPNKLLLGMIDGAIQVRSHVDLTFYSLVGSRRSGGAICRAQVEVHPQWENGAPNNASSQTKNSEITPFILG
ncbi:unnamed protein product [Triticum turgidum subsp. durum]|uniref:Uncharacterized protein ycf68 n=2 Tax=Triticum TaxID=4564 RepID=A0A9R0VZP1_TRITD|nr:unnamed protein product [Triticum turgidum subsp. durum]